MDKKYGWWQRLGQWLFREKPIRRAEIVVRVIACSAILILVFFAGVVVIGSKVEDSFLTALPAIASLMVFTLVSHSNLSALLNGAGFLTLGVLAVRVWDVPGISDQALNYAFAALSVFFVFVLGLFKAKTIYHQDARA